MNKFETLRVDFNQYIIFIAVEDTELFKIELREEQLSEIKEKQKEKPKTFEEKLSAASCLDFTCKDKPIYASLLEDIAPIGHKAIFQNKPLNNDDKRGKSI